MEQIDDAGEIYHNLESEKTEHVEYTGYKFLDRELKSKYGTTWQIGKWKTQAIDKEDRNGSACGVGLHLMKTPNPVFMPYEIGFFAKGRGLLGEDDHKMRFEQVKLIRVLRFSEIFYAGANLFRAYLTEANLTGANLTGANLRDADLTGANLFRANLTKANLFSANLTGAKLFRATLRDADLTGANLFRANLTEANLFRANLTKANLFSANLRDADLTGANLTGATLRGADLTGAHRLTGIAGLSEVQRKQIHC